MRHLPCLTLVARDTGERHTLAYFLYNRTGNPAAIYGPIVTPRAHP
jgi:hypothetical protein